MMKPLDIAILKVGEKTHCSPISDAEVEALAMALLNGDEDRIAAIIQAVDERQIKEVNSEQGETAWPLPDK